MSREGTGRRRILFYSGGFAAVGGTESFLAELGSGLVEHGHAVKCVCWGADSEVLQGMRAQGVSVIRQPFRWGCRFGWPDRFLLRRGLREVAQADLVFLKKLFAPSVYRALAAARGPDRRPPFVFVTPYRPAEMWRDAGPDRATLESLDAIVVQAPAFEDDLRHFGYEGEVRIIPLIPPLAQPCRAFPSGNGCVRIGFLGRLAAQKNLSYLLEAFSELMREADGRKYELHLFGDGRERPKLEARAAELGVLQRTAFHGAVAHECVPQVIDSCHLFAFSSVTEGQCLAALEILARGRPIVATPVGALPDVISEPCLGVLAPLGVPEAFAGSLAELSHRILAGDLIPPQVRSAYDRRFSRSAVVKQYADLVRDLTQ